MITGNTIVGSYVSKTNRFINKSFKEYMTISTDYVVVTNSNNPIDSTDELVSSQTINYSKYSSKNMDIKSPSTIRKKRLFYLKS